MADSLAPLLLFPTPSLPPLPPREEIINHILHKYQRATPRGREGGTRESGRRRVCGMAARAATNCSPEAAADYKWWRFTIRFLFRCCLENPWGYLGVKSKTESEWSGSIVSFSVVLVLYILSRDWDWLGMAGPAGKRRFESSIHLQRPDLAIANLSGRLLRHHHQHAPLLLLVRHAASGFATAVECGLKTFVSRRVTSLCRI